MPSTVRAELAAIHVAKKQLALADDTYRLLVLRFSAGRTETSRDMTGSERRQLLDHFRALGFGEAKPRPKKPGRKRDDRPQANKLRALWLSLWNLGVVHDRGDGALAAFLKRRTGIEALQWADIEALDTAIDCLRGWCDRVGYHAAPFKSGIGTPMEGSFKPGLIRAQWDRLAKLGAFEHGIHSQLGTYLMNRGLAVAAPQFLTNDRADDVIADLGMWLRRIAALQKED